MGNNLKKLRLSSGLTQDQAAQAMGTTRNYYVKLEGSSRRLGEQWIKSAAKVYGVDPGDIVREDQAQVPLVGYVGAGAAMTLFSEGQGPFDFVEAPDGATSATVAVEIRGQSLGELFDQWLVYYDDVHDSPGVSLTGRLCVVGLADGRVLVKKLQRGQLAGRFNLLSNTEPPIYDAEVVWAAKVKQLTPR
jgi:transcriptional regulator with XRE-family HTH domain